MNKTQPLKQDFGRVGVELLIRHPILREMRRNLVYGSFVFGGNVSAFHLDWEHMKRFEREDHALVLACANLQGEDGLGERRVFDETRHHGVQNVEVGVFAVCEFAGNHVIHQHHRLR